MSTYNGQTTGTTTWLGRCVKCRKGFRVDTPARVLTIVSDYPDDAIREANRLRDSGVLGSFGERMAWLRERAVTVERWQDVQSGHVMPQCCGRGVPMRELRAKYSETECSAKCTGATGPACECKCEGRNHGGRFL